MHLGNVRKGKTVYCYENCKSFFFTRNERLPTVFIKKKIITSTVLVMLKKMLKISFFVVALSMFMKCYHYLFNSIFLFNQLKVKIYPDNIHVQKCINCTFHLTAYIV